MQTQDITRPDPALISALHGVGTATASGELYKLGIKNPHMTGLTTWKKGKSVVPVKLAPEIAKLSGEKNEWEVFTTLKLSEGGDVRKYYPLNEEARAEFDAWKAASRGAP